MPPASCGIHRNRSWWFDRRPHRYVILRLRTQRCTVGLSRVTTVRARLTYPVRISAGSAELGAPNAKLFSTGSFFQPDRLLLAVNYRSITIVLRETDSYPEMTVDFARLPKRRLDRKLAAGT